MIRWSRLAAATALLASEAWAFFPDANGFPDAGGGGQDAGGGGPDGGPPCDGASCSGGCCEITANVCHQPPDNFFCGLNGNTCISCTGAEICAGGQCIVATTCTCTGGCCMGPACTIEDDQHCGPFGMPCMNCAPGHCVSQQCVAPACSSSTCPLGCCDVGTCFAPPDSVHCGLGGNACSTCLAGWSCDAGICVPPLCNQLSCPNGCCDSNNACQTVEGNSTCGTGGIVCAQCDSASYCDAGTCVPIQCAGCNTCCAGASTCVDAGLIGDALCGNGGVACQTCQPTEHCIADAGSFFCVLDAGPGGTDAGNGGPDAGSSSDGGSVIPSGSPFANLGCNCSDSGATIWVALAAFALVAVGRARARQGRRSR